MPKHFHTAAGKVNAKTLCAFRRDLLRWYRRHKRDLPWRHTRDPYRIWISEIMLQQTRVETVCDYYQRWLRAFPDVTTLARTPFSRVHKLWEGLGYYTRARNLHRAARHLVRHHAGQLPVTAAELRALPGIGPYTAAAVASIAFNEPVPVVDGNVARVLARVFAIADNVKKPGTLKKLSVLAGELLPLKRAADFNQAMMELGALVCLPGQPHCESCSLRNICLARAQNLAGQLPNRGPRPTYRRAIHNAAYVRRAGKILLRQRPHTGQLAGMWELPALPGNRTAKRPPILVHRHTITNQRITLRVFRVPASANLKGEWFTMEKVRQLTIPAAHRHVLNALLTSIRSRSAT
jgi:A/G-specific adenine glycosylase